MASYNQVSYGSGDKETVLELQKLLNQKNNAGLTEDGIFGSQTQQAVKNYQQANGLAVDGIVGNQTWGSLTAGQDSTDTPTTEPTAPAETAPSFEYKPYQPSDAVTQAEALLKQQLANKPGAYTSPWQSQLNDIIQQIQNREKFSYDMNADALYQQYKDQYTTQGKMAMMDTMGQAQAMTGGYGNSYAQSVGQQAYQGYLQQLNDKVPELYQLALNQYNREGDDLYNQASLMAGMEEMDYGRYRDQMSDYYTELDRLTSDSRYQAEQDYNKWADDQSFGYQQYRDQVSDEQWQAQFDEAKRQYDEQMALSQNKSSGSSSSSSGDGARYTGGTNYTTNPGYTKDEILSIQKQAGIDEDGIWGPDTAKAYDSGLRPKTNTTPNPDLTADKDYFDYDQNTHEQLTEQNGGSYYQQTLSYLKQMKQAGKSNKEAMAYLSDMVGYSYLSQSEYMTLYNKYRDNRL